jgi:hypothetical protein
MMKNDPFTTDMAHKVCNEVEVDHLHRLKALLGRGQDSMVLAVRSLVSKMKLHPKSCL